MLLTADVTHLFKCHLPLKTPLIYSYPTEWNQTNEGPTKASISDVKMPLQLHM